MAKVSKKNVYPVKLIPSLADYFPGTDTEDFDRTKSFEIGSIINLINSLNGTAVINYVFSDGSDEEITIDTPGYFFSDGETNFPDVTNLVVNKSNYSKLDLSELFDFIGDRADSFSMKLRNASDPTNFAYFTIFNITTYEDVFIFNVAIFQDFSSGQLENNATYLLDFSDSIQTGMPTKTSDLTNDGANRINPFITAQDLPSPPNLYAVSQQGFWTDVQLDLEGGAKIPDAVEDDEPVSLGQLTEILEDFSTSAILIQSQKAVITNIGGNTYSVVIPMTNTASGKSVWQAPDGTIFERTTDYLYITNINMAVNNRIDVIWVDFTGAMGHELGDPVAVGTPASYPSNKIPANAMQYTFITFINGEVSSAENLTPQQVQTMINNSKPNVIEMTSNQTLSFAMENKYIRVEGTLILTIPPNLLATFFQCFIYVASGSLTVALGSGVTAEGYYSLVLTAQERATLTKRSPLTNQYMLT